MDLLNLAFWVFVAIIAGIYVIMALGLYVQFSLAGLPNFGHVAFMAVAAYTMAILVVRLSLPLGFGDKALWRGIIVIDGFDQIPGRTLGYPLIRLLLQEVEYLKLGFDSLCRIPLRQVSRRRLGHAALHQGGD